MRISRTTRSCRLRLKVYETYSHDAIATLLRR